MKLSYLAAVLVASVLPAIAQDPTLAIIEEKVNKLQAEVEAAQFKIQRLEKQLNDLRAAVEALPVGGATAEDVRALQARIAEVDAARQRDRQIIIDQLAKELATLSTGSSKPPVIASGKEHVVQRGETLTSIARQYGVTVADLRKANNLTSDNLAVNQKLIIPDRP